MIPFGELTQGRFFFVVQDKKMIVSLSHYKNNMNSSWGGAYLIKNIGLIDKLRASFQVEIWSQPKELDFKTNDFSAGGSGVIKLSFPMRIGKNNDKFVSMNLGVLYKTNGFLLGEPFFQKGLFFQFGGTYSTINK